MCKTIFVDGESYLKQVFVVTRERGAIYFIDQLRHTDNATVRIFDRHAEDGLVLEAAQAVLVNMLVEAVVLISVGDVQCETSGGHVTCTERVSLRKEMGEKRTDR